MKSELIQSLTSNFEAHAQQTDCGTEYWLTRYACYLIAQNGDPKKRGIPAVIERLAA